MGGDAGALRVAFLVDSLVVGGAERVLEALVHGLPRHGVDVVVGCLREPGPVGEALRAAGVAVAHGLAPRRLDPTHVLSVGRWLGRTGADVVYVLDHSNALFYGRVAARAMRRPSVVAVHRTRRADGTRSLGAVDRALMPWTRLVVAVSRGQADYLAEIEGVPRSKLRVVYNGVDPDRFVPAPSDEAVRRARMRFGLDPRRGVAGVVAALRPEKNHETLLRVWSDPAFHDADLLVVGDGARRPALEALARELGVVDRVHWAGWTDRVTDVLHAIDVLVLPSHPNVETFPMCVLEAMAAARPVVATRVGSLDEMVDDGTTGWLVEPGDETALRDALVAALQDPAEGSRRGRAGRARVVERFGQDRMVEGTVSVLRQAVGRRVRRKTRT